MQKQLESVPEHWPLQFFFSRYGAKAGLTVGVNTIASYAVPRRGLFSGQSRVVVILANQLDPDTWNALVQHDGLYYLQKDLAHAGALFDKFFQND